jgi:hypothetical protein
MDARIWHAQATTAPATMPSPLTAEQCGALTSNERHRYVHDLQDSFERLLLPRAQTEPVQSGMDRILRKNARQRPGAKRMIMLDAPFATGKSTMVKDWAQGRHRDWLGEELSGDPPTWRPQPGMTADLVPVVYATLRSASKVKEVNAQILAFLGYPNEGVKRVTTTMVVAACSPTVCGYSSSMMSTCSRPDRSPAARPSTTSSSSTPNSARLAAACSSLALT